MKRVTPSEEIEALATIEELDYEPDHLPKTVTKTELWNPDFNPTQKLVWEDPSPFVLLYGEKGSGKSIIAEYKMVRHCVENWDALGVVVTPSIRTGRFGVVHDLETLVLPAWTEGIGLEWLPSRLDPQTKDRIIKLANRFGGWSTIIQISIPYEEAIEARIKSIYPSFFMVDELTDCEGSGYFTRLAAQLNRRRHITGPQQYVATCNPKGPSHWVYQTFFEDCVNLETGVRDPKFKVYHIPFTENAHRPELKGYMETLEAALRSDPIERERLINGKWIERPTGESLFANYYIPDRHVVGNAGLGTGLRPVGGFPCLVGYDIGQVYHAAIFEQYVVTASGPVWIVFDEIVHLKEKITFKQMAIEVVERLLAWNSALERKIPWEHITDDSAVNQWRPGSGSYDSWEFEREFNQASLRYGLGEMRMRGCPKGAGSIEARVRLFQGHLHNDQLLVSDTCEHVKDMLRLLESEKSTPMNPGNPLKPRKTAAGHIHVFDAASYPMLKMELLGSPAMSPGAPVRVVSR